MPYIKKYRRIHLEVHPPITAGELNYKITEAIKSYLSGFEECYEAYNSAIGALECAKLELYRRKIAPYENKKMEENGDVY